MKFKAQLLQFILFFTGYILFAQDNPVKTRAYLDSAHFFIGDKIILHLEVETPNKYDARLDPKPKIIFDTTAFEIKNYGDWKEHTTNAGQTVKQLDIALMAWDSGAYTLSVAPYIISNADNKPINFPTDSVKLSVQFPNDAIAPAPINDIIKEESQWQDVLPFLIPIATALVIAFAFWRLWKYYKKRETPSVPPIIKKIERAPRELALQQMDELKLKNYPEGSNTKQFYTELSDIVRGYIERQFEIPALENTSNSIINALTKRSLKRKNIENLRNVLSVSDLAKFALVTPSIENCHQHWQEVYDFVKSA